MVDETQIDPYLDLALHAQEAEHLRESADVVVGEVEWKDGGEVNRVRLAHRRCRHLDAPRDAVNRERAVEQERRRIGAAQRGRRDDTHAGERVADGWVPVDLHRRAEIAVASVVAGEERRDRRFHPAGGDGVVAPAHDCTGHRAGGPDEIADGRASEKAQASALKYRIGDGALCVEDGGRWDRRRPGEQVAKGAFEIWYRAWHSSSMSS